MTTNDESSVSLWLAVALVYDSRRKCSRTSSPVVIRDDIIVLVESALRLFVDDTENLIDCAVPWRDINELDHAGQKVITYSYRS